MLNDAPALSILIASMLYMIAGIVAFGMKGRIRAYKGLSANGIVGQIFPNAIRAC